MDKPRDEKRHNKRLKPALEAAASNTDLLAGLPVAYDDEDFDSLVFRHVTLEECWWHDNRDGLVEEALQACDPGGQVSLEELTDKDVFAGCQRRLHLQARTQV